MKLETKRLILRKPRLSDWKDFVEGLNDFNVSKNLKFEPYPYRKKNALNFINGALKEWERKNKFFYTFSRLSRQNRENSLLFNNIWQKY